MSYAGLSLVTDGAAPHLGGNIGHGDPFTFAPNTVDYLIKRFAINSMLDLGSGQGHTAALFHRQGVTAIACDGLLGNVRHNVIPRFCATLRGILLYAMSIWFGAKRLLNTFLRNAWTI